jgi:23S rRNA (adenine-N6)-dimethyltransferase
MSQADKRRSQRTSKHNAKRTASQERGVWNQPQRKRRRKLSQNFLKDEQTARKIVGEAGITDRDLVVEFGAGAGMITRALSKKARKVLAVEYDPFWVAQLKQTFSANENVKIVAGDALSVDLPNEPFRTVANLPFHISTSILHRLLDDPTQPLEFAHLLVQKEFATKHARASPTTLKTLGWSPWYRFEAGFVVPASAFDPRPEVDACLLVAAKRGPPLVASEHRELFRALVRGVFNGRGNVVGKALRPVFSKKQIRRLAHDNGFSADSFPSQLTVYQWANIFEFMVRTVPQSRWPMPESTAKHHIGRAGQR